MKRTTFNSKSNYNFSERILDPPHFSQSLPQNSSQKMGVKMQLIQPMYPVLSSLTSKQIVAAILSQHEDKQSLSPSKIKQKLKQNSTQNNFQLQDRIDSRGKSLKYKNFSLEQNQKIDLKNINQKQINKGKGKSEAQRRFQLPFPQSPLASNKIQHLEWKNLPIKMLHSNEEEYQRDNTKPIYEFEENSIKNTKQKCYSERINRYSEETEPNQFLKKTQAKATDYCITNIGSQSERKMKRESTPTIKSSSQMVDIHKSPTSANIQIESFYKQTEENPFSYKDENLERNLNNIPNKTFLTCSSLDFNLNYLNSPNPSLELKKKSSQQLLSPSSQDPSNFPSLTKSITEISSSGNKQQTQQSQKLYLNTYTLCQSASNLSNLSNGSLIFSQQLPQQQEMNQQGCTYNLTLPPQFSQQFNIQTQKQFPQHDQNKITSQQQYMRIRTQSHASIRQKNQEKFSFLNIDIEKVENIPKFKYSSLASPLSKQKGQFRHIEKFTPISEEENKEQNIEELRQTDNKLMSPQHSEINPLIKQKSFPSIIDSLKIRNAGIFKAQLNSKAKTNSELIYKQILKGRREWGKFQSNPLCSHKYDSSISSNKFSSIKAKQELQSPTGSIVSLTKFNLESSFVRLSAWDNNSQQKNQSYLEEDDLDLNKGLNVKLGEEKNKESNLKSQIKPEY